MQGSDVWWTLLSGMTMSAALLLLMLARTPPLDLPSPRAGALPELVALLAEAGWEPTPELSGAFRPGNVYWKSPVGHRLQLEDCFSAQPTEAPYTGSELITNLQGGVSVGVFGVGRLAGSTNLVKQLRFGSPVHRLIPALKLRPTQECVQAIEDAGLGGANLDEFYVVQEVLAAEITEQTCGRVDARGRFLGLSEVDVEASMACSLTSLEPVSVGYRTIPLRNIMGFRATEARDAPPPGFTVVTMGEPTKGLGNPLNDCQVDPVLNQVFCGDPSRTVRLAAWDPAVESGGQPPPGVAVALNGRSLVWMAANTSQRQAAIRDHIQSLLKAQPLLDGGRLRVEVHLQGGVPAIAQATAHQIGEHYREILAAQGIPPVRVDVLAYGATFFLPEWANGGDARVDLIPLPPR